MFECASQWLLGDSINHLLCDIFSVDPFVSASGTVHPGQSNQKGMQVTSCPQCRAVWSKDDRKLECDAMLCGECGWHFCFSCGLIVAESIHSQTPGPHGSHYGKMPQKWKQDGWSTSPEYGWCCGRDGVQICKRKTTKPRNRKRNRNALG